MHRRASSQPRSGQRILTRLPPKGCASSRRGELGCSGGHDARTRTMTEVRVYQSTSVSPDRAEALRFCAGYLRAVRLEAYHSTCWTLRSSRFGLGGIAGPSRVIAGASSERVVVACLQATDSPKRRRLAIRGPAATDGCVCRVCDSVATCDPRSPCCFWGACREGTCAHARSIRARIRPLDIAVVPHRVFRAARLCEERSGSRLCESGSGLAPPALCSWCAQIA